MSEFLLVSLGHQPEEPVEWLVWNPDESRCVASGQLAHAGELPQLAQQARTYPCYVLVPQEQVFVTEVKLPNSSRAALSAIPYQLEEQLCDDPALLHFAVGTPRAECKYSVAIIARTLIGYWRDQLLSASIPVKAMFADAQSLQYDPEQLTAIPQGERLLINGAEFFGLALTKQELDSWRPILERRSPLEVLSADQGDSPLTPLAARLSMEHAINLLQGEYKLQDPTRELLRNWRIPAALGLMLLTLTFVSLGIENYRLSKQKSALDQEVVDLFREAFPDVRRVVDPRVQMEQKLNELRQHRQGSRFLRLLEKAVPALQKHESVRVTGMRYAQNNRILELELESAAAPALEKLAAALKQDGLQAQLGQTHTRQQNTTAQITIQGIE
ncbi:type II secretion system protein L [Azotobacter armeniacus]